jgi:phosphatidylglycerophosphate synthase
MVGMILLSLSSAYLVLLGAMCFHLFFVLDYSDGEVARYNKQSSITGHFLDRFMHLVRDTTLFSGLALGAFLFNKNIYILIFGFSAIISIILCASIVNCGWAVICWTRLTEKRKGKTVGDYNTLPLNSDQDDGRSASNKGKVKFYQLFKLLLISVFSHKWLPLLLLFLAMLQLVINNFTSLVIDFRSILIVYTGFIGPFYLCYKLHWTVKNKSIEASFNGIFGNQKTVKIEDYFFQ